MPASSVSSQHEARPGQLDWAARGTAQLREQGTRQPPSETHLGTRRPGWALNGLWGTDSEVGPHPPPKNELLAVLFREGSRGMPGGWAAALVRTGSQAGRALN